MTAQKIEIMKRKIIYLALLITFTGKIGSAQKVQNTSSTIYHNGWIDLLVQLGWIGVIGVGLLMLSTVLISVFRLGGAGRREGYWSIGYLLAFLVLSLSESVLLSHANLPWALFLTIFARAVSTERSQIRPPVCHRRGTGRLVMARPAHRTSFAPAGSLAMARYPRRDWT